MPTIIEAIFEHGVLRPLDSHGLHEARRYRLILEEISSTALPLPAGADLEVELAQRTTTLPDGKRIIRIGGLLSQPVAPDAGDPIADALDTLRHERMNRFRSPPYDMGA